MLYILIVKYGNIHVYIWQLKYVGILKYLAIYMKENTEIKNCT